MMKRFNKMKTQKDSEINISYSHNNNILSIVNNTNENFSKIFHFLV